MFAKMYAQKSEVHHTQGVILKLDEMCHTSATKKQARVNGNVFDILNLGKLTPNIIN